MSNNSHAKTLSWRIFLATLVVSISTSLNARAPTFSLTKQTRNADLIFTGRISKVRNGSMVITVDDVIKGKWQGSEIDFVAPLKTHERNRNNYPPGMQILIFAKLNNNKPSLYAASQSIMRVDTQNANSYKSAVLGLLTFDRASGSENKSIEIAQLLTSGNEVSQIAALDILYLETHSVSTDTVIPPVARLVNSPNPKVAVNAIHALTRIGGRSEIPLLLSTLSSNDKRVADTAHRALRRITRARIDADRTATPEKRAQRWREWWANNSGIIQLKNEKPKTK